MGNLHDGQPGDSLSAFSPSRDFPPPSVSLDESVGQRSDPAEPDQLLSKISALGRLRASRGVQATSDFPGGEGIPAASRFCRDLGAAAKEGAFVEQPKLRRSCYERRNLRRYYVWLPDCRRNKPWSPKGEIKLLQMPERMVLPKGIEPLTSALPRMRSTTELRQHGCMGRTAPMKKACGRVKACALIVAGWPDPTPTALPRRFAKI